MDLVVFRSAKSVLLALAFLVNASALLQAQTVYYWSAITNPVNLNWGGKTNWIGSNVPNAPDTVASFLTRMGNGLNLDASYAVGSLVATNGQAIVCNAGNGTLILTNNTYGIPIINIASGSDSAYWKTAYIGGSQGFLKLGSGAFGFSYNNNSNTIRGPIIVGAGTLTLQWDGSLGYGTNSLTLSNGVALTWYGNGITNVPLLPSRTIYLSTDTTAATMTPAVGQTVVVQGTINELVPGSSLTLTGSGALVFSNANNFSGVMTVSSGTNILANSNAVQYCTLTVNGGVVLFDKSVTNKNFTCGGLAGTGDVALQNNASTPAAVALTVGGNNASTILAGDLTGAGSLIKTGTGTLTISGANTYTGTTTISAGKLVTTTASVGGGSVSVADGATNNVQVVALGQTLTNSNLTLGTSVGATMEFNNLILANPTAPIVRVTNLTLKGTIKVNIYGPPFAYYAGTIPLLAYGSKSVTGAGWSLGTLPAGMVASLNDTGSQLQLVISSVGDSVVSETVSFSATNTGYPINPAFCGFSYEKAKMTGSLFVASDISLLGMMSQLGPGVLRIGAASVNSTCWNGLSNCPAITTAQVDALAGFVNALPTNWSVIYAVNQVSNTAANGAAEAAYVANALGSRLLGFEIGNEPDLYHDYYRTNTYSYANFLAEWQPFAAAITNTVPGWAATNHGVGWIITGPATSWNVSGYTLPFVTNEAKVISMATHHYYRNSATNTGATMMQLMTLDAGLPVTVSNIVVAASYCNLSQGYRVDESGSFSGGGNTNSAQYGSALWALDVMFTIAVNGGQGINFHSGGSGASSYTPIADNGYNVVEARPEYYGMKIFSLAAHGNALPAAISPAPGINFAAYGIRYTNSALGAVLNNKDATNGVQVTINLGTNVAAVQPLVLVGPALNSTSSYTLGGAPINPDGSWAGGFQPAVFSTNGQLTVTVVPMSALWLNPLLRPVLAPMTNRAIIAGATLSVTNQGSDLNVPAQPLRFFLPTAPSGASINSSNGIINWRPAVAQSGTSNQFVVVVTNTSSLAATQNFWVNVIAPQKPVISAPHFTAGHFNLTVSGSAGPDYTILGATNLVSPVWHPLFTNFAPVSPFQWTDTNTVRPQFYYRVQLGP